eukprot:2804556-Pleurochrysis_carterae.AAC.1
MRGHCVHGLATSGLGSFASAFRSGKRETPSGPGRTKRTRRHGRLSSNDVQVAEFDRETKVAAAYVGGQRVDQASDRGNLEHRRVACESARGGEGGARAKSRHRRNAAVTHAP